MRIIDVTYEVSSRSETLNLYLIGDTHIGTIHHDRQRWLDDVRRIADDDHALWLHCGDAVEAISLADPRFEPREIDPELLPRLDELPYAQIERFVRDIEPIASKCIGLMAGNHEHEYLRRHYGGLTERACRMLWGDDVDASGHHPKFLSDTAFIRLRLICRHPSKPKIRSLVIFAQHGVGGGRKPGSKLNNLADMTASFEADIYVRGHTHERLVWQSAVLGVKRRGKLAVEVREPVYVICGSYYRGYDVDTSSYIERRCLPPRALGCVRLTIRAMDAKVVSYA